MGVLTSGSTMVSVQIPHFVGYCLPLGIKPQIDAKDNVQFGPKRYSSRRGTHLH